MLFLLRVMCQVAFVLACLACLGHGRRSRHSIQHEESDVGAHMQKVAERSELRALGRVLDTLKTAPAFNPSASATHLPKGKHLRCIRTGEQGPIMGLSGLKTGIVGMPNVGKSTLFNALMQESKAQAANFPFCTIDPNEGIIAVPDPRLDKLVELSKSEKKTPTTTTFVDIAGLVAGASKGEGLGNKFLSNIRECDAIIHVARCFIDDDVIHVDGTVDPVRDIATISLELALADLAQVEKRMEKLEKEMKKRKEGAEEEMAVLKKIVEKLDAGEPARKADLTEEEIDLIRNFGLLTLKPIIYAANVADAELSTGNEMVEKVKELAKAEGAGVVTISAQVESELVDLDGEERQSFLEELGVEGGQSGLDKLIVETYRLLGLRTYFTSGVTESRAWTIKSGMLAPQAAGVIHSDFEKGFIRAETVAYDDYVEHGGETAAKAAGKWRSEGKDYEVQEGDVILFRFNV